MASAHDSTAVPTSTSTSTPERFAHYMIRVSRRGPDHEALSGLVERLGSGEKERFETTAELMRLLAAWPDEIA